MPVVPLRGMVAFPAMVLPLFIGREKSVQAVQKSAESENKLIFLVTQRDEDTEEPGAADLFQIGVVAEIMQWMRLPDGNLRVIAEGRARAVAVQYRDDEFLQALVAPFEESEADAQSPEYQALLRRLKTDFESATNLSKKIPPESLETINEIQSLGEAADSVVSYVEASTGERQQILEESDVLARAHRVVKLLTNEIQVLEIDREIESQVKEGINDNQREYFLRERLKSIQEKLGERDPNFGDAANLRTRIEAANMPAEAKEKAL